LTLDFLAALAFLTRLPIGRAFDAKRVARAQRFFPLVGALIGAIEAGTFWLLARYLPPLVAAILIVALDVLLTGAMHYDGLADTADGFGGGHTRDDVLRIMRDHAIGSYGAVALVLAVGLKAAAIAATPLRRAVFAILLAPAFGRWAAVLLSATVPYARPVSDDHPRSAGSPARFVGRVELGIATGTVAAFVIFIGYWRGGYWRVALSFAAAGVAAALWAWRCRRRIGGVTGDTLGAAIEAVECLVLLVFAVVRA